ncbi:porin [Lentibacter algarum]|uniref:porin n=1 Tax=Lentibacter algarum TaxID=576131 RepID=UPI001C08D793|nr:porin [Lentibacter algarum]MBU2983369.1 porin [Lentibacter algarum]
MKLHTTLGLLALSLAAAGSTAQAQSAGFSWEGSAEIGIDSTVSSGDPTAELTDTYLTLEAAFEAALSERVVAFGGLTFESVTDATGDRAFEDMGLYIAELGVRFSFGETEVALGKLSPAFGVAWDEAPGFYGTSLAEDYELSEMIGATLNTSIGANGALSFALFYADNTELSNSIGTKRGRNTAAAGGVGNTGKLNNVALQYTHNFGDTTAWIGGRFLSAGLGDVSDETGIVAGVSHSFGNGFDVIAEVAHFNGAGGTADDATYATLGGAYSFDDWTFSATASNVDFSAGGNDTMLALGVDRAISDSTEINFGVARFDIGGVKSTSVGLAAVMSF